MANAPEELLSDVTQLIAELANAEKGPKVHAARTLALIDDERALIALEPLLADPSARVRLAAASALNSPGYESTDILANTLIDICRLDDALELRQDAFEALEVLLGCSHSRRTFPDFRSLFRLGR